MRTKSSGVNNNKNIMIFKKISKNYQIKCVKNKKNVTYLEKSRRTTQMMINIKARPAKIPIIAGSIFGDPASEFAVY